MYGDNFFASVPHEHLARYQGVFRHLHAGEINFATGYLGGLPMQQVVDAVINNDTPRRVVQDVIQTTHGFATGDVIRMGTTGFYFKALADNVNNAEAIGVVSTVDDANTFHYTTHGLVENLASDIVQGQVFYLDPVTSGLLTGTEPDVVGQISKPVLLGTSTGVGVLLNYRGAEVNLYSQTNSGPWVRNITTVDGDLLLNANHQYIRVQSAGGNRTITLPSTTDVPGREYLIQKVDAANTVTIQRSGNNDYIDTSGTTSITLTTANQRTILISSGTTFWLQI